MTGVSACSLPDDYVPDILFDLEVQRSAGAVTVSFDSVMGQDWCVTCQEVIVSDVAPCGPRGESTI